MAVLVLKKFSVTQQPEGQFGDLIHIVGRQPGLVSFILSLMGIDPVTELRVNTERVSVRESSLFGVTELCVPLSRITGIAGGYQKPKELLFLVAMFWFFGFPGIMAMAVEEPSAGLMAIIGLTVISAVFLLIYFLQKRMTLFVQNGGDKLHGLTFKRSVIENVAVDDAAVQQVVYYVNQLTLVASRR